MDSHNNNDYKLIDFFCGGSLKEAYKILQQEAPARMEFNGKMIYSSDTLDEVYIKVTGKNYADYCKAMKEYQEKRDREKREHIASIPQKTIEYREKARGIIPEDKLEMWDRIVPVRLKDLYRGMELDSWLELIAVLNDESKSKDEKMSECLRLFDAQGHSGMSASLLFSGLKQFHPLGAELVDFINSKY